MRRHKAWGGGITFCLSFTCHIFLLYPLCLCSLFFSLFYLIFRFVSSLFVCLCLILLLFSVFPFYILLILPSCLFHLMRDLIRNQEIRGTHYELPGLLKRARQCSYCLHANSVIGSLLYCCLNCKILLHDWSLPKLFRLNCSCGTSQKQHVSPL